MNILGSDRKKDLSNINTGGNTNGLSVRVTHTGRQTIGSGTRKHLIGSQNMVRVGTHTNVVVILSDSLSQMLIDGNTGSLKSFRRDLLLLVTDQMGDKGKQIDRSLLGTDIVNTDLRFGDTTTVTRLDVRLVLLVTVATSWTTTHLDLFLFKMKKKKSCMLRFNNMVQGGRNIFEPPTFHSTQVSYQTRFSMSIAVGSKLLASVCLSCGSSLAEN
mmetsp:Transcript_35914/g.86773  ORF Transcript_35914/g.86773 Transcript_35914/m.86773 type:complete len:215 (+) Transcript_35914:354-998(+)